MRARTIACLEREGRDLMENPVRTERMEAAIREIARPDAAGEIAEIVRELAARKEIAV